MIAYKIIVLEVPQKILDKMVEYARQGTPYEACGLLGGQSEGPAINDRRMVQSFYPMTNADKSPIHYSLDPKEQFQVMKKMREQGEELVGIFHSHVASPARPSSEDVRLAYYPGVSYVLVSLLQDPPMTKSYIIENGNVSEEEIAIQQ